MTISDYVYRCSAGETFDSAALAIYGDERYAAELMSANPELCGNLYFSGGENLRLPVVETVKRDDGQTVKTAPWKEG